MKYADPSGHAECIDAECRERVNPKTGNIIGDSLKTKDMNFGLDFYTEIYNKSIDAFQTLPENTGQVMREGLENAGETIQQSLGTRERSMNRGSDTILGSEELAIVLGADGQWTQRDAPTTGSTGGVQIIMHPSGNSLQITAGSAETYGGGASAGPYGGVIFNAKDLDSASQVDQAVSVDIAFGEGATVNFVWARPLDLKNRPWGVTVGPAIGGIFQMGHTQSTSIELFRWNSK